MADKLFYICQVIAEDEDDYKILQQHLGNYPVKVSNSVPRDGYYDIPTLLIGWNYVKHNFPKINILDKQIDDNLFWTYSKSEMEKIFHQEVEEFFVDSIKKWLPSDFELYDPLFDKIDLLTYVDKNINRDKPVFVYFGKGASYFRNDNKNYIVNIKSLSLVYNNFKDIITSFLNSYRCFALSYNNFYDYINPDKINDIVTIENLRWVKFGVETSEKYFNIIPNFEIDKYVPFLMSKLNPISLDEEERRFMSRMCKRDLITCWMSRRDIAFNPNFQNNNLDFRLRKGFKLSRVEYSNKRTITGRITAHDNYNPQNLQRDNQDRANIITRFEGGSILVYDYTSFETRISLLMCDDKRYIEKYANADLHRETAVILFERSNITDEERNFSKILNHSLLYGASEETLLKKLSNFKDPDNKLYQIKQFLFPIIKRANEVRQSYKDKSYIVNDWGSIVRTEKVHASFNNLIQSTASEIVVDKVFEIRELLRNKKSQFLFQVHDSLVFDIHPEEKGLIKDIGNLLSIHKNMHFTLTYRVGADYKNLSQNIVFQQ